MANRGQSACNVRRSLGAFAGLIALLIHTTPALAAGDLSRVVKFTIPEQPMREALLTFSAQADVQVVADASLVSGKRSAGVDGKLRPERAMAILLNGSGLGFSIVNGNTFAIRALIGTQTGAAQGLSATPDAPIDQGGSARLAQAAAAATNGTSTEADKSGNGPGVRAEDRTNLDEIVVTGSRLASNAKEGGQDVLKFTRQQIDNSGQTSVSDFLNTLTDVSVATTGGGEQTFAGAGTARLHGLPVGTTLVLINGRPVETTGGQAFFGINIFDMNSIPLAAVERIEVLPSGSSAIYGSDGLAGVVNIILRKDFDGLEANVKYGGASGTRESDAHVAWGDKWDKGSFSVIGSYQKIGEMDGFARTLTGTQDYTPYGGPDTRQAFCPRSNVYSTTGGPLPGLGSATFAGVPAGFTGTPTQAEFQNSPLNLCSYFGYISQIPGAEREGLNLNAHYELTPSLDLLRKSWFPMPWCSRARIPRSYSASRALRLILWQHRIPTILLGKPWGSARC